MKFAIRWCIGTAGSLLAVWIWVQGCKILGFRSDTYKEKR